MATTRKLPPIESTHAALASALHQYTVPGQKLALGLSGGIDSVSLLHALCHPDFSHYELCCVHVHHGLSPHADAWADFCEALCARFGLRLSIHRVVVDRDDPAGIEGAARTARQQVFAQLDVDVVLTAHHQNDQAETLLLQLLRGAGPKGLAAMAEWQPRSGWRAGQLRPWLQITRTQIAHYARAHGLAWIEDESNTDTAYSRNYLRHTLLPMLGRRFPSVVSTLARSAALQAEANELLQDLAKLDAESCVTSDRLDCRCLAQLSLPRARNLLRWFIEQQGLRMPSERRLDEGLRQLLHAASDARVSVMIHPGFELRRFQHGAYLVPMRACTTQARVRWQGEPMLRLEYAGWEIAFHPMPGAGLSFCKLNAARVELGVREGGERLRLEKNGVHHSLKNLLQEARLPSWQRACMPLLWCDGQLVWVSGIGYNPDYLANSDELGIVLASHAMPSTTVGSGIIT